MANKGASSPPPKAMQASPVGAMVSGMMAKQQAAPQGMSLGANPQIQTMGASPQGMANAAPQAMSAPGHGGLMPHQGQGPQGWFNRLDMRGDGMRQHPGFERRGPPTPEQIAAHQAANPQAPAPQHTPEEIAARQAMMPAPPMPAPAQSGWGQQNNPRQQMMAQALMGPRTPHWNGVR